MVFFNSLRAWQFCMLFVSFAAFFTFSSNNASRNSFRVSNSLDSDQSRRYVGSDLGPNYLQRLSADSAFRH